MSCHAEGFKSENLKEEKSESKFIFEFKSDDLKNDDLTKNESVNVELKNVAVTNVKLTNVELKCVDCQMGFDTKAKLKYHRLKLHGKWQAGFRYFDYLIFK